MSSFQFMSHSRDLEQRRGDGPKTGGLRAEPPMRSKDKVMVGDQGGGDAP